jgi:hypothetical protein
MENDEAPYDAALRRIADQEDRIRRQECLVEAMKENGLSTRQAEELLDLMRATLGTLRSSFSHYSN